MPLGRKRTQQSLSLDPMPTVWLVQPKILLLSKMWTIHNSRRTLVIRTLIHLPIFFLFRKVLNPLKGRKKVRIKRKTEIILVTITTTQVITTIRTPLLEKTRRRGKLDIHVNYVVSLISFQIVLNWLRLRNYMIRTEQGNLLCSLNLSQPTSRWLLVLRTLEATREIIRGMIHQLPTYSCVKRKSIFRLGRKITTLL